MYSVKTDTCILDIKKDDFEEYLPTQLSIARLYSEFIMRIAEYPHLSTHEQIYEQLENEYITIFGYPLPWKSFDSFRMWYLKNKKYIYEKT